MAKSSQARRVNRAVGVLAVILLLASGGAWLSGREVGSVSPSDTTSPSGEPSDISAHSFLRPADTSLSWFFHSGSREQFDYEMSSLSCGAMARYISIDLCTVVHGSGGSFMLVGTEGYWDPAEPNSRGIVNVPLDLTVYVLTKGNGPSRAMSILDGSLNVNLAGEPTDLEAYVAKTATGEVLVLHKKARAEAPAAYDFWDELQVIAASPTGAPTLVAAYEGSNIKVLGDGVGVVFESDRYASPSGSSRDPVWSTFTYLMPATGYPYSWAESMKSGDTLDIGTATAPHLAATYKFPSLRSGAKDA